MEKHARTPPSKRYTTSRERTAGSWPWTPKIPRQKYVCELCEPVDLEFDRRSFERIGDAVGHTALVARDDKVYDAVARDLATAIASTGGQTFRLRKLTREVPPDAGPKVVLGAVAALAAVTAVAIEKGLQIGLLDADCLALAEDGRVVVTDLELEEQGREKRLRVSVDRLAAAYALPLKVLARDQARSPLFHEMRRSSWRFIPEVAPLDADVAIGTLALMGLALRSPATEPEARRIAHYLLLAESGGGAEAENLKTLATTQFQAFAAYPRPKEVTKMQAERHAYRVTLGDVPSDARCDLKFDGKVSEREQEAASAAQARVGSRPVFLAAANQSMTVDVLGSPHLVDLMLAVSTSHDLQLFTYVVAPDAARKSLYMKFSPSGKRRDEYGIALDNSAKHWTLADKLIVCGAGEITVARAEGGGYTITFDGSSESYRPANANVDFAHKAFTEAFPEGGVAVAKRPRSTAGGRGREAWRPLAIAAGGAVVVASCLMQSM